MVLISLVFTCWRFKLCHGEVRWAAPGATNTNNQTAIESQEALQNKCWARRNVGDFLLRLPPETCRANLLLENVFFGVHIHTRAHDRGQNHSWRFAAVCAPHANKLMPQMLLTNMVAKNVAPCVDIGNW